MDEEPPIAVRKLGPPVRGYEYRVHIHLSRGFSPSWRFDEFAAWCAFEHCDPEFAGQGSTFAQLGDRAWCLAGFEVTRDRACSRLFPGLAPRHFQEKPSLAVAESIREARQLSIYDGGSN